MHKMLYEETPKLRGWGKECGLDLVLASRTTPLTRSVRRGEGITGYCDHG